MGQDSSIYGSYSERIGHVQFESPIHVVCDGFPGKFGFRYLRKLPRDVLVKMP